MIAGLQKMTLLDFPGKVACTVFLQGCNFRCPFCHNSGLLSGAGEELMTDDAFFSFLDSRKGLLDGVCVSGGEPTLMPGIGEFLRSIKDRGFAVKLDTNGSRPEMLKALVEEGLVDYVAMDVKNSPSRYGQTVGLPVALEKIEESLRFLMTDKVAYELRTTLVLPLHDDACMEEMGKWLAQLVPGRKPRQLYLQQFVDRETVLYSGLSAPEENTVLQWADTLSLYIEKISVRGDQTQHIVF